MAAPDKGKLDAKDVPGTKPEREPAQAGQPSDIPEIIHTNPMSTKFVLELSDYMDYEPYYYSCFREHLCSSFPGMFSGPGSKYMRSNIRYCQSSHVTITLGATMLPVGAFVLSATFGFFLFDEGDVFSISRYVPSYTVMMLMLLALIALPILLYLDIRRCARKIQESLPRSDIYIQVLQDWLDFSALKATIALPFRFVFPYPHGKTIISRLVHCGRYLDYYVLKPIHYVKPEWYLMLISGLGTIVTLGLVLAGRAIDLYWFIPCAFVYLFFSSWSLYLDRRAQYIHILRDHVIEQMPKYYDANEVGQAIE